MHWIRRRDYFSAPIPISRKRSISLLGPKSSSSNSWPTSISASDPSPADWGGAWPVERFFPGLYSNERATGDQLFCPGEGAVDDHFAFLQSTECASPSSSVAVLRHREVRRLSPVSRGTSRTRPSARARVVARGVIIRLLHDGINFFPRRGVMPKRGDSRARAAQGEPWIVGGEESHGN